MEDIYDYRLKMMIVHLKIPLKTQTPLELVMILSAVQ